MGSIKIFIDGREGTTGLQIEERLKIRPGVSLIGIDDGMRKDVLAREECLNAADIAFLCLPDDAAREAVSLVKNNKTIIIDASTAHRTHIDWAYGFPDLSPAHRERIIESRLIAVPGCYASGFCAIVYPLVTHGLLTKTQLISCFGLSGYSGGGKKAISTYECEDSPRGAMPYSLTLNHKHLPEMAWVCGLSKMPVFIPVIVDVRQGMLVNIPLELDALQVWETLNLYYKGAARVGVMPFGTGTEGYMSMEALNGRDNMEIFVFGNAERSIVTARLDNLGKGASGAAVECMDLKLLHYNY